MRHDIIEYAEISPVIGRTVTVYQLFDTLARIPEHSGERLHK